MLTLTKRSTSGLGEDGVLHETSEVTQVTTTTQTSDEADSGTHAARPSSDHTDKAFGYRSAPKLTSPEAKSGRPSTPALERHQSMHCANAVDAEPSADLLTMTHGDAELILT